MASRWWWFLSLFSEDFAEEVKKNRTNQRADRGSHDIAAKEKDAPLINLYKQFIICKIEAQNLKMFFVFYGKS